MATFEEHIEGLTNIDITSSSVPNQTELTTFLVEGVIDCVNKMIIVKPNEISKFTSTTNGTGSVQKKGQILSVAREHDSTDILRPATPINPSLRYEATDKNSLNYRSKYNPGFYELNGNIHCVPAPNDASNNDIVVTQVNYDTGLVHSDNYQNGVVENFPLEYENLIALYAAAMVCNAKANDIHNNMPTVPTAPNLPDFAIPKDDMPDLPIFHMESLKLDLSFANLNIMKEDLDKADKYFTLVDKNIEEYSKNYENALKEFESDMEVFKSDLERSQKNSDRETQVNAAEYQAEIDLYKNDLDLYQGELQKAASEYRWYASQYVTFMTQYNQSIGVKFQAPKRKKEEQKKPRREEE